MSKSAVHRRFEDILSTIQQPARLTGGEMGAGPGFPGSADALRVVLGFPDTYEIGISNQSIQILYHLARKAEGVEVERVYLPWVDAISAMRREAIPLLTLETWSPVVDADLMGLTLQHESTYTNVLEMLDLAGIPLHCRERTEAHPVVVAGGPACANFLPLSRFLDAAAVGDGEEMFPEILEVMRQAKRETAGRAELKRRLAEIEGVYVPGLSDTVTRRTIPRLEGAPYPETCLVPLKAAVHDRAWVEIMRGCTRGCRFCQAGMWYRPVRERSPGEVLRMGEAQLLASGHQELAFASLSTTDYSCLEQILVDASRKCPEVRVSLPSLRVDSAAVRLARLASPTGPSLTLAPEAGSQRMRDIINKNVNEADFMAAAEEAFRTGRTAIKLYFMMGLPMETDGDVVAIADSCVKVRDLGRRLLGANAGRVQIRVSVNNFVPKPFTPFQWAGMTDGATLTHRQGLLRFHLRKPGVRLVLHPVDRSYLEAALARGGQEMGAVIEDAWKRGARFDSWTEQFREQAWAEALAGLGTTAEKLATAFIPRERPLPWDIIKGVADKDFLWSEWLKAGQGARTGDCRWDGCLDCGACRTPDSNDLAVSVHQGTVGTAGRAPAHDATGPVEERSTGVPRRRLRYLATFSVTGRSRFLGHLDRLEVFRRAVRRAGGRLALSAGMRPKPLLSIALPLAVGVEGLRELAEFELVEEADPGFIARLAESLPGEMQLLGLERYWAAGSLPARVVGASYEVGVSCASVGPSAEDLGRVLAEATNRFSKADEVPVEEVRRSKVRSIDVKKYVDCVSVAGVPDSGVPDSAKALSFRVAVTPKGTVRPERVVEALGGLVGAELRSDAIKRVEIHLS